jgi:hypothetical protein
MLEARDYEGARDLLNLSAQEMDDQKLRWRGHDSILAGKNIALIRYEEFEPALRYLDDMFNKAQPAWYAAVLNALCTSYVQTRSSKALRGLLVTWSKQIRELTIIALGCVGIPTAVLVTLMLFFKVYGVAAIVFVLGSAFFLALAAKLRRESKQGAHAGVPVHKLSIQNVIEGMAEIGDLQGLAVAVGEIRKLDDSYKGKTQIIETLVKQLPIAVQPAMSDTEREFFIEVYDYICSYGQTELWGQASKFTIWRALMDTTNLELAYQLALVDPDLHLRAAWEHHLSITSPQNSVDSLQSIATRIESIYGSDPLADELLVSVVRQILTKSEPNTLAKAVIIGDSITDSNARARAMASAVLNLTSNGDENAAQRLGKLITYRSDVDYHKALLCELGAAAKLGDPVVVYIYDCIASCITGEYIEENAIGDLPPAWFVSLVEVMCYNNKEQYVSDLLLAAKGSTNLMAAACLGLYRGGVVVSWGESLFMREMRRARQGSLLDFWNLVAVLFPLLANHLTKEEFEVTWEHLELLANNEQQDIDPIRRFLEM